MEREQAGTVPGKNVVSPKDKVPTVLCLGSNSPQGPPCSGGSWAESGPQMNSPQAGGKTLRREEGSAQGDRDGVDPQSWDVDSSKSESSPAQMCLMGMKVPCWGEEKGKMTDSPNLEFEPKICPH